MIICWLGNSHLQSRLYLHEDPTCDTLLESSFHVLFVRVNKFFLVLVYRNLVSNVFHTGGVVT